MFTAAALDCQYCKVMSVEGFGELRNVTAVAERHFVVVMEHLRRRSATVMALQARAGKQFMSRINHGNGIKPFSLPAFVTPVI